MFFLVNPEVFSTMVAFSKNKKDEKTILFATVEDNPKIFVLNLHDLSISVLGRVVE
ncbi:hypothetical protein V6C27_10940 [Peptococcaceae bacterium 1198_IL3148]